jgi:branched-chain amino acid transport system ATP-binding protein
MLEVTGLHAAYGRAQILFGIDLALHKGEVAVLLGRNGAGKSTTMRAVMGLLRPSAGRIRFLGEDIERAKPHRVARLGLGYVPEDRRIFTDLTVEENLEVGRQPARAGVPHWTAPKLYKLFPSLGRMKRRLGGRMSGGEQQMLTIARTLMGNPAAVLLDEPSEGLAPVVVEQMVRTLRELKREGLAILLSEQNMNFAAAVADRAYLIEQGHIRHSGDLAAVRERYQSL